MDSYCTIYFNDKYNIDEITVLVNNFIRGKIFEFNTIKNNNCTIDIISNPDHNPLVENLFPDGFLNFSFRMEISFEEHTEISFCIEFIGKLLIYLWNIGVAAIAASDYENLLPEKGGYKSALVPWNKNVLN